MSSLVSTAQNEPVHNLVFEGAGIRGIAYAGAISELENRKLLAGVKRIGGTSAGAITALTLTLGYTADEITALIGSTSFQKFNDGKFFFPGGLNRLRTYYGWYRGQRFEQWLEKLIAAKTGDAHITFEQLHRQGYKDLYVTGTSLNQQKLIVFSYETYPHMQVKDAVRISMSIPLYFEAVFMDTAGHIIPHPKNTSGLDVMVDGGLIANFPIRLFDSTRYMTDAARNLFAVNPYTRGFRVDSDPQIANDTSGKGLADRPIANLKNYITAFYTLIIENLNRQTLTADDWKRTLSISDGGLSPRIRKLSPAEIQTLLENGRRAVNKMIDDGW